MSHSSKSRSNIDNLLIKFPSQTEDDIVILRISLRNIRTTGQKKAHATEMLTVDLLVIMKESLSFLFVEACSECVRGTKDTIFQPKKKII